MLGETLGSYKIVSKLGEGGMGAVYVGEHPLIGRKAAIKVLLPQFSADADVVNRFFNEARAANLIKHPSIVDIYDFGHHPSGCAFIVMELLDGESLGSAIKKQGKLPLPLALEVTRQLAAALGAAHERGVIHRDLKPDNVFLVPMPDAPMGLRVKVLDFGIAKLVDPSGTNKTNTHVLLGTPLYMSPEQCRGAGYTDHRSDIYSLGCVLFQMLCGRVPFVGEGPGDLLVKHIAEAPPAPRSLAPELPDAVEKVILRALAKKPDERFQTMAEVGGALASLGAGPSQQRAIAVADTLPSQADARPVGAAGPTGSTTLSRAASQSVPIAQAPRSSRTGLIAGGLVALALVGGGVVWKLLPTHSAAAVPSPTPAAPVAAPVVRQDPAPRSPTVVATPAPAVATPARVKLHLDSRPSGAEVVRVSDGTVLGNTPWDGELARGAPSVPLAVRLAGYRTAKLTWASDRSRELVLNLAARLDEPPPPRRASHAPSTSAGEAGPDIPDIPFNKP